MPRRRFLLLLALASAVLVIAATASLWLSGNDASNHVLDAASWATYTNREHGYEIDYPSDWELTVEPTKCDSNDTQFCVQSVEVRQPSKGEVYVFVNFQGGWECDLVGEIVLSERPGREYRCDRFTIRSFVGAGSYIRFFPELKGKRNVAVFGQAVSDISVVEAIVRRFRFID